MEEAEPSSGSRVHRPTGREQDLFYMTSTTSPGQAQTRPADLPANAGRAAAGIAIVLVAQLMFTLDATVVNVALPRIDIALGFGPASLSWVLNAFTLAFGGLLLLGGRLGDVFCRRRVFLLGLTVFTIASFVGGLAMSPGWLVASRAAQGVGAALAAPGVLALLTTSAPDEPARLRALALFGAVSSSGLSIGLLLGGAVTDLGSWRWTMFINVPIGLAVVALTRRYVDETPRRPGRFDFVGALTATGGAVALVWSLIGAPEYGWGSPRTVLGLVAGALLLAGLGFTDARVANPLLRPSLLRSRQRVGGLAIIALVVGGQLSMFFLVVQFIQHQLGFGPVASGLVFLPMMVTGSVGLTVSFVWLSTLTASDTYLSGVLGPMLVNGVSAALVFMPVTAIVLGGVEREHAGAASGLLQTFQQLGGAVGLAVIVSVYAAGSVPGEFLPGARAAFLTSATMAALAGVVSVVALSKRRTAEAPEPAGELDGDEELELAA